MPTPELIRPPGCARCDAALDHRLLAYPGGSSRRSSRLLTIRKLRFRRVRSRYRLYSATPQNSQLIPDRQEIAFARKYIRWSRIGRGHFIEPAEIDLPAGNVFPRKTSAEKHLPRGRNSAKRDVELPHIRGFLQHPVQRINLPTLSR